MNGISIIICTYNGADRIIDTLDHIAAQDYLPSIACEVVLVDNNSSDGSGEIAAKHWHSHGRKMPLTVIKEHKAGLSHARKAGFSVSKYDYIIFCDDDNWLSANYVTEIHSIFERKKEVAVIGTQSFPAYEQEPPNWFKEHEKKYAIGKFDEEGNITNGRGWVWGAGVAFQKSALSLIFSHGYQLVFSGRTGKKMTTGEDVEICYALRMLGCCIFYTNSCHINHYMPVSRFDLSKFYSLAYHNGFSSIYLGSLYNKAVPPKKKVFIHLLRLFKFFVFEKLKFYLVYNHQAYNYTYRVKNLIGALHGCVHLLMNHKYIKSNVNVLLHNKPPQPISL